MTYNLNEDIFKSIHITSQEHMIIKSFGNFYDNLIIINLFTPILNSNSKISIRLIDYFVTKYSKYNKINYKLIENNIEIQFNVYTSYKQQLKAFQKKHFDPFSRGDRIPYFIGDTCIITTIGQLNFFKWFISKKIYDYVKHNHITIENDMNKKNKNDKKKIKNISNLQDKNIILKKTNNIINKNIYINNIIPNINNNNQLFNNESNKYNLFKENKQIIVKFSF
jgi:hypothetical protein